MPKARLIEKHEVQRAVRRRTGEHVQRQREEARRWLKQAKDGGRAIELTLGANERDETVKARYRAAAKEEDLKIRFQTAIHRNYTNRKGVLEQEAEVLIVLVQNG